MEENREMVKVRLWVMTDRVGSKCERTVEFEREDWEGWNNNEKDKAMEAELWNGGMIEWGYEAE